ncbi:MAG: hypothetical protein LBE12_21235, partial [Planctomycetaceae bacterium]|nr:hypothetical protein [Planctomycetaceae bacterium]
MSQADYYLNGNNSVCDTIHSQLSTTQKKSRKSIGIVSWAMTNPFFPLFTFYSVFLTRLIGVLRRTRSHESELGYGYTNHFG